MSEENLLLGLQLGLLEAVWPAERAVLGMRVCKQLHQQLSQCTVLLAYAGLQPPEEGTLTQDLARLGQARLSVLWAGDSCDMLLRALTKSGCAAGLTSFTLHKDWRASPRNWQLAEALGCCEHLAHLDLANNKIGPEQVASLAGGLGKCKALAHVNLAGNEIGGEGAGRLVGALGECKALTHLDLSANQMGKEGIGRLAGVLGECTALVHLDLSRNKSFRGLDNDNADETDAGRLVEVLRKCKALAHLNLGFNGIGTWSGWERLLGALGECQALAHLDLSSNSIQERGARRLADVLGECRALARLDLSSNAMGPNGVLELASVLGACKRLVHLKLASNAIGGGAEGAAAVGAVLREGTTIAHLDLAYNSFGAEGARHLVAVLQGLGDRTALCRLSLSNNWIGEAEAMRLAGELGEGQPEVDWSHNGTNWGFAQFGGW